MSAKPGEATPGDDGTPPRWADVLTTDPTSGQSNRVAPPAAIRDTGFAPYRVKPPRNWINELLYENYLWQQFFEATSQRAATRTVAASNSNADSRRMADYVCDGTADDVQINAAITAIAATGGRVLLSEGTFTLSAAIAMSGGITLQGQGGETTIQAADDVASHAMISAVGTASITIRDMVLDGRRALQAATSHAGIILNGVILSRVIDVYAGGFSTTGALVGEGIAFLVLDSAGVVEDLLFQGCTAEFTSDAGFAFSTGAGANTYVRMVGCHANSCDGSGFEITADYVDIAGCSSTTDGNVGFLVLGDYVTMSGCSSVDAGAGGVSFSGANRCVLSGCTVTNPTTTGISIAGASSFVSVSGCLVDLSGSTGIYVEADDCAIDGCTVQGAGAAGIRISGGDRTRITGCTIDNPIDEGVVIVPNGGDFAFDCVVTGCLINSPGDDGIYAESAGYLLIDGCSVLAGVGDGIEINDCPNLLVDGCMISSAGSMGIEAVGDGAGNLDRLCIRNCTIEGSQEHGISISQTAGTSQHLTIDNNLVIDSGAALVNTWDDIILDDVNRCNVRGNSTRNPSTSPRYSVHLTATATNVVVAGNHLQQGATAGNLGNAIQEDAAGSALPIPTTLAVGVCNEWF